MTDSPFGAVKDDIIESVAAALKTLKYSPHGVESSVDFSKGFGDLSCSISFRLSKEIKKSPNDVANEIAAKLKKPKSIEKVTVENGFINFHLDRVAFSKDAVAYALKLDGKPISDIGKKKRVIIEYPSANPIHPLHVGQLRNMLIGDSLSRIYDSCGYVVEREDYIDDLGLQMMEALYGYINLKEKKLDRKFDHWLGNVYVEVNKQMEQNDLKKEFSKLAQLVEQDGTFESKLNKEVAENVVRAQYDTMFKYDVYHDVLVWEGDILKNKLLDKTMNMMLKNGFVEKVTEGEYNGCIVIDLNKIKDLPKEFQGLKENVKVLVRADGTPTYVAKDIAFHAWKFGLLPNTFVYRKFMDAQPNGKPLYTTSAEGEQMDFGGVNTAINIIDVKQSFPQEVLKLAFRVMQRNDIADGITHLAYGRVELEEGTLAGRKGTWVGNTADDLYMEATKKAKALITQKVKIEEKDQEKVANTVGLGAIKFDFLKMSPEKNIIFSWKWALSFEGNSGPYCQYTYARAKRMIEDSGINITKEAKNADMSFAVSDSEFQLAKLLSMSKEVVEKTCREMRSNNLTEYAIQLASAFSKFYEEVPILKAKAEVERKSRLALTLAFAETMKYVLSLLGISVVERM